MRIQLKFLCILVVNHSWSASALYTKFYFPTETLLFCKIVCVYVGGCVCEINSLKLHSDSFTMETSIVKLVALVTVWLW